MTDGSDTEKQIWEMEEGEEKRKMGIGKRQNKKLRGNKQRESGMGQEAT